MAAASSSLFHANIFMASKSNSNSRPYVATVAAIAPSQTRSYLSSIQSDIEAYLKTAIPIRSPESVFQPMRHLTFAAPRTTAPALCVVVCELLSGERTPAILAAASSIHLMHAAAHTHQHLPLTDTAKPATLQHKFGPNIELLTGDGIVPFGMELLARSMDLDLNNQDRILRVIVEISRAGGSQGMVDGLYQESENLEQEEQLLEIIEHVCMKKEGELHACGAACGAILGGGSEEEINKVRKVGLCVGIAQGMVARKNTVDHGMELEAKAETYKKYAIKEMESCFQDGKKIHEFIASIVEPSVWLV